MKARYRQVGRQVQAVASSHLCQPKHVRARQYHEIEHALAARRLWLSRPHLLPLEHLAQLRPPLFADVVTPCLWLSRPHLLLLEQVVQLHLPLFADEVTPCLWLSRRIIAVHLLSRLICHRAASNSGCVPVAPLYARQEGWVAACDINGEC